MDIIWVSQVLIGVFMALLGWFVFKRYPFVMDVKTMSVVSLLIVLAVLLGSYFKLELPLLGPNSFEIKFDTLPIIFIGILFGPGWGFISGFMSDIIQLLFSPTAFPFLGFTLNLMLSGVIAGILFSKKEIKNVKTYSMLTLILVVLLTLGSVALVWIVDAFRINGEMMTLTNTLKISISAVLLISGGLLSWITLQNQQHSFSAKYLRVLILCEVLIQMVLTSLWLVILFKIDFWLLMIPRIIEGVLMVLILQMVGLLLYQGLFKNRI